MPHSRHRSLLLIATCVLLLPVVLGSGCGSDGGPYMPVGPYMPIGPPMTGSLPIASFTVTPASGATDTVFGLDASGCSDIQDPTSALEVRWDWNDDGTYDTGWSTTKTITYQYTTTGTKSIRMEVKNTRGLTSETTRNVSVTQ